MNQFKVLLVKNRLCFKQSSYYRALSTATRRCSLGNTYFTRFSLTSKFIIVKRLTHCQSDIAIDATQSYVAHTPVLLNEALKCLSIKDNGRYLDMTFGAGGHCRKILEENSKIIVYSLDRDPSTWDYALELQKDYPNRFHPMIGKFSELPTLLREKNIGSNYFSGIIMDLGVSSMQFNSPERGFMLSKDGPLDMRMDKDRDPNALTAADILCHIDEESLRRVIKYYGGEKNNKLIARAIVEARMLFKRFKTTKELSDLVSSVLFGDLRSDKLHRFSHPATKTFQALRILVNDELNELDLGIRLAHFYLNMDGNLCVISFHSLEDTIAKRHFLGVDLDQTPESIGVPTWKETKYNPMSTFTSKEIDEHIPKPWKSLYKHVVLPDREEVVDNPRSRSAKLRCARKISLTYCK